MYARQLEQREPNHRCPNCGHTFGNTPGNGQCYKCGEQDTDRGEDAGLWDPFHASTENHTTYDESGEW